MDLLAAQGEAGMLERFIHEQNLEYFRRQLAEAKNGPTRQMLLVLLAEEEGKEPPPKSEK